MTMIDEEWLAETVRHLGAAIDVPSDGPAQVMTARRALTRNRPTRQTRAVRSTTDVPDFDGSARDAEAGSLPTPPRPAAAPSRRRQLVAAGVALTSVAVVAVALMVTQPSGTSSSTTAVSQLPHAETAGGAANGQGASTGPSAGPAVSGTPAAPPVAAAAVPARIVKTGSVALQVGRGKLSPTVDQLTSLASALGGYVANATTAEGGGAPTGDLTLRVPVDQFETLLSRTRALGRPTAVSTSGQDVTAAYVDLDARIQALQDTRTQYLQILSKATAIGDILSVEQQLSGLQTQIEQLQGQQKVLADQTALGTLTVHLSEPGTSAGAIPAPRTGLALAWDHARHSFAHGVEAVVGASGGVLVFLMCAALLLLAVRLVWPVLRRRLV